MGPAFSEPKLIAAASGFEAATKARILPQFLQTLPLEQAVAPRRVPTDNSTGGANTGGDNQSSRHLRHL
jgi:hypothetical protein